MNETENMKDNDEILSSQSGEAAPFMPSEPIATSPENNGVQSPMEAIR